MITQGADINAGNALGFTPLHCAALFSNLAFATLLIENDATIDIQNHKGNTPLHCACEQENVDVVKLLWEKGADINSKNNKGDSPLHIACEFGRPQIVEFLISKGALVDAANLVGITPLHFACDRGFLEIVNILIQNKANVNAKDDNNNTPLHCACTAKKSHPIITLLIKKGADVNAVTKDLGWTPLHWAAMTDNTQACKVLLNEGANPSIITKEGMTALDIAYYSNYKKIITLLQPYNLEANIEADKRMRAFFAELNREAISKKKKTKKRKNKSPNRPQPTVEISPEASSNFPELSSEITADELMINQLIEEQQIEPIVPAAEIVIETPSTASPVVQPTPSAPSQERPIKIAQQISQEPSTINEPAPHHDGYLILIGQNLKWPHLNKNQEQSIREKLLSLKNWPKHGLDIKQLKGEDNMYRLREGNYRIIFSVDTARREIKIQKIGSRKGIYKKKL